MPKDLYSPIGENYHYEAQPTRFLLSSCGKDGIYGNADDPIYIGFPGGAVWASGRGCIRWRKKGKGNRKGHNP